MREWTLVAREEAVGSEQARVRVGSLHHRGGDRARTAAAAGPPRGRRSPPAPPRASPRCRPGSGRRGCLTRAAGAPSAYPLTCRVKVPNEVRTCARSPPGPGRRAGPMVVAQPLVEQRGTSVSKPRPATAPSPHATSSPAMLSAVRPTPAHASRRRCCRVIPADRAAGVGGRVRERGTATRAGRPHAAGTRGRRRAGRWPSAPRVEADDPIQPTRSCPSDDEARTDRVAGDRRPGAAHRERDPPLPGQPTGVRGVRRRGVAGPPPAGPRDRATRRCGIERPIQRRVGTRR